jgi:RNA polymerase sigma-54 factor
LNLALDLSLKLQQKLSFQMIQSLKLLQVNTLQLEQMLKTELEMNPVLEAVEELEQKEEEIKEQDEKEEDEGELEVKEEEIDWEEYLEEGFDLGYSRSEEIDPNKERYEPTAVHQASLEEHLNNQLAEKNIPENQKLLVQFLIGCIESDGYLRIPTDQIAEYSNVSPYEIEEALNIIWNMEPVGLGARNLQECLTLQLYHRGFHGSLAIRIVTEEWELFEKVKIRDIARNLKVDPKEVVPGRTGPYSRET